jgi:hypothetical protein
MERILQLAAESKKIYFLVNGRNIAALLGLAISSTVPTTLLPTISTGGLRGRNYYAMIDNQWTLHQSRISIDRRHSDAHSVFLAGDSLVAEAVRREKIQHGKAKGAE